ncbi:MAG: hypothetical protein ACK5MV_00075 [Aminipila sp.]
MNNPEREKQAALQMALQNEIDYICSDMPVEEFIDEYVYIESKDDPRNPVIKFSLWPEQKRSLKEIIEHKLNIVLKARQMGFTWLILSYICKLCLEFKGYTAIVLSESEGKSKELINRVDFILRHLPDWLILEEKKVKELEKVSGKGSYKGLYYIKSNLQIEIVRPDGESSTVKAQPATEGAGRSLTADIVFFDEWAFHRWASDIFDAAYPTINRPTSGKFVGLSTNRRGSFFESVWKNAASRSFHKIFLNCFADPRRDEAWYEKTAMALKNKVMQEYPRTEEEALLAGDNVSFPEFSFETHTCEPFDIPEHWRRFASVDNGYNDPFAWYKYAVSEDGTIYIYYELSRWREEAQVIYSDQAREFNASLFKFSDENHKMIKEKLDYIVAGLDAWHGNHRDNSGKNLIDYYRDGGLNEGFIQAITDRKLRKATLHEYLKPQFDENTGKYTAKLQIFRTCEYLIEVLPQLVNDDNRPEVVADLSDIDNPYDSLGYGLISHHAQKSIFREEEHKTRQQAHKERLLNGGGSRRRMRRRI